MSQVLGSGTFSTVRSVSSPGRSDYALKCNFRERELSNIACVKELDVLRRLCPHEHICSLSGTCPEALRELTGVDLDGVQSVFEFAKMDMHSCIYSRLWSPRLALSAALQLLLALEHCHNRGVMHRDVKPANVLVTLTGDTIHCLLCDFGMAKPYSEQDDNTPLTQTVMYRPPEVAAGDPSYDYKSDIWAAGCTLFEMFSGRRLLRVPKDDMVLSSILRRLPVEESDVPKQHLKTWRMGRRVGSLSEQYKELLKFSERGEREMRDQGVDIGLLSELLSGMLQFSPGKRLSAKQCVEHDFFRALPLPPRKGPDDALRMTVVISPHRKAVEKLALRLCSDLCRDLYECRALFHALECYDRVAPLLSPCPDEELVRLFTACFYLQVKYFPGGFRDLTSYESLSDSLPYLSEVTSEEHEKELLSSLGHEIYRVTPYELVGALPYSASGHQLQLLFRHYLSLPEQRVRAHDIVLAALEGR